MIKALKANSGDVKLRIDRASPDLVAEAMLMEHRHRTYTDAQIIGTFHHYTIKDEHVEVEVITTRPPDLKEVKQAAYMGYSLSDYRRFHGPKSR